MDHTALTQFNPYGRNSPLHPFVRNRTKCLKHDESHEANQEWTSGFAENVFHF